MQPTAVLKSRVTRHQRGEQSDRVGVTFVRIAANMSQLMCHDERPFNIENGVTNDRLMSQGVEDTIDACRMQPWISNQRNLDALCRFPIGSVHDLNYMPYAPRGFFARSSFVVGLVLLHRI